MKISVITPTVLGDFPVFNEPRTHILSYVPQVLANQNFDPTEFELVVVDALWEWRHGYFIPPEDRAPDATYPAPWCGQRYEFSIIHAPPMVGWALKHRKTNHGLLRNTGLCLANGELVFLIDDTLSMDNMMLQRVWDEYQAGYCISPLVEWCYGDHHVGASFDWRVAFLEEHKATRWVAGQPAGDEPQRQSQPLGFGIIAYPLELALDLGGYDEMYDAGTQYLDTTFGMRLSRYCEEATNGRIRGVVIDKDVWCRHEAHELPDPRAVLCYDPRSHGYSMFLAGIKCNRVAYLTQNQLGFPRVVNKALPTREMYSFFQHCPYYREVNQPDGLGTLQMCEGANLPCKVPHLARQGETPELADWLKNLRVFDLRELRATVRREIGMADVAA